MAWAFWFCMGLITGGWVVGWAVFARMRRPGHGQHPAADATACRCLAARKGVRS